MASEQARKAKWDAHYAAALDKFWERVDRSGGPDACWPWMGCTKPGGYGFITHKRRARLTHRVALANSIEDQPALMACHRCDNPICCNPGHLFWGDAQANNDDCSAKGRKRGAARKLDLADVTARRARGESYAEIAAVYSVNQASVGKALKRIQKAASAASEPNTSEQST